MQTQRLGKTDVYVPRVVHGTSSLGNLYAALPENEKLGICRAWFETSVDRPVTIDSAGKYGAGLALEVLGRCLRRLKIDPREIVISNKLGWRRTTLRTPEPTFEPGVWKALEHDAEQSISYDGILTCWEQGCELLGRPYRPSLISVHDPDEYLTAAGDAAELQHRRDDIREAYRALNELKARGEVQAIGVGAKDWRVIDELSREIALDWVMLAGSLTIQRHPPEVLALVERLVAQGVGIINSAVFQAGFLAGGKYLDYRMATPEQEGSAFAWRESFFELCQRYSVTPAVACIQFALSPPGVAAVALNTSSARRVAENIKATQAVVPTAFWREAKDAGLIASDYPWV